MLDKSLILSHKIFLFGKLVIVMERKKEEASFFDLPEALPQFKSESVSLILVPGLLIKDFEIVTGADMIGIEP